MELVVHCDADALLALTHAEGAAQLYLIFQVVLFYQVLQLLDDLAGAFEVAGAADANGAFQSKSSFLGGKAEWLWQKMPVVIFKWMGTEPAGTGRPSPLSPLN